MQHNSRHSGVVFSVDQSSSRLENPSHLDYARSFEDAAKQFAEIVSDNEESPPNSPLLTDTAEPKPKRVEIVEVKPQHPNGDLLLNIMDTDREESADVMLDLSPAEQSSQRENCTLVGEQPYSAMG